MTSSRFASAALAAGLVLGAALAGCGSDEQQAGGGGFQMPPLPVETAVAATSDLADRFTAVGSLDAEEVVQVTAETDGRVTALPIAEGRRVEAGELLARLDDVELRAQVDRAAALLEQRQVSRRRTAEVVDRNAGTPQDLDDAVAAEKVAAADLALARARLDKTRIAAPFAGTVGAKRVSVGTYVRAGTAIADLADLTSLRVEFTAPERLLARLALGAPVEVRTSAWPDRALHGTVDVIDPVVDAGTRSVRVTARLENPDGALRPGMSAEVAVTLDVQADALTVPSEAVFVQNGGTLVYVVNADSTVAPRPVTLGLRRAANVQVTDGLAPGERVVRAGHQKLFPGAKVLPLAPQTADDGS